MRTEYGAALREKALSLLNLRRWHCQGVLTSGVADETTVRTMLGHQDVCGTFQSRHQRNSSDANDAYQRHHAGLRRQAMRRRKPTIGETAPEDHALMIGAIVHGDRRKSGAEDLGFSPGCGTSRAAP